MRPTIQLAALASMLCGCVQVSIGDERLGGTGDAGDAETGPDDPSATGVLSGSTSGSAADEGTGSSSGAAGSSSEGSSGALECDPSGVPYMPCDQACGSEACGEGLRCVGDAFGYAMCVSPCETVDECEPIGWAAPHDVVICQSAPLAVYPGGAPVGAQRWCWPPCADVDTCPEFDGELLGCTSLGGDRPVCVWPPPE